jgi:hypothetical protein
MSRTTPNLNKYPVQPPTVQQPKKTKLAPYVGFFTIGFILASTIAILIQSKFMLNSYLVMVLSVLLGTYIAVHKFIKHQHRALNNNEINRLTFASIGIVWLLAAVYLLGLWLWLFDAISREVLLEMIAEQPFPLLGALVMMIVITLVSARLGFWLFNRLLNPNDKTALR